MYVHTNIYPIHGRRRHSGWSGFGRTNISKGIFIILKKLITTLLRMIILSNEFVTILSLEYTIWYGKYGKEERNITHKLQLSC